MKNTDIEWVLNNIDDIELLDVRSPEEFGDGCIPGSKNIPMMGLMFNANTLLDKNKTYYISCFSGNRSLTTATELKKQGYNVVNVQGGYSSYLTKK